MASKPTYSELEKKVRTLENKLAHHRQIEDALTHRIRIEKLVSHISATLIDVSPENLDGAIQDALEQLGVLADVDRCYIFMISDDRCTVDNTQEWCRQGIEPQIDNFKELPIDAFSWWMNQLEHRRVINIPSVDGMPAAAAAEKKRLQSQNIVSLLVIPMAHKDRLLGFLGFDAVRAEKLWPPEDILLLRTIGNILSSALERKKNEEALMAEHQQMLAIFNGTDEVIYVTDPDTYEVLFLNSAAKANHDDAVGQKCYRVFQDLSAPCPFCTNPQIFGENLGNTYAWEVQNRVNQRWYRCIDRAIRWPDGRMVRYEMAIDITPLKETEAALTASEKRFRELADMLPEAIFEADPNMTITYANPQAFALFGYTRQEFERGLNGFDMITVEGQAQGQANYAKRLAGQDVGLVEYEGLRKDGTCFPVLFHIKTVYTPDGTVAGFKGIIIDITERKRMHQVLLEKERRLARSQKMESLGLLVGGVAHDLNNVLSGIAGIPDVMLMNLPPESSLRPSVEIIKSSGARAVAMVEDLLTVARGLAVKMAPVNLNQIVRDYLSSPEFQTLVHFHPGVTVDQALDDTLFAISGSALHLRKALMNLVSNAAEAITGAGTVRVSTANRMPGPTLTATLAPGDYVVLSVADDGPGIADDDLTHIFEPFYTKKVIGRSGTGLGLAVVENIMQDHGGHIELSSRPGGSVFELWLPALTSAPASDTQKPAAPALCLGKGESVLVIDDQEHQREVTGVMLQILGYRSETASSGEAALEYVRTRSADVLVLDMIMRPGMDGLETYEKILELSSGQKALIVSGYSETDRARQAMRLGAGAFLKKPFQIDQLGLALRKVLDGECYP